MIRSVLFFLAMMPVAALASGGAQIMVLNKVTARSEPIELAAGELTEYRDIIITLTDCVPDAGTQQGDAAMLDVTQMKEGRMVPIFRGWLFSESASLNAMEHPVLDIQLTGCSE